MCFARSIERRFHADLISDSVSVNGTDVTGDEDSNEKESKEVNREIHSGSRSETRRFESPLLD